MKLATSLTVLAAIIGLSAATTVATQGQAQAQTAAQCNGGSFDCDPCCRPKNLHTVKYHWDDIEDRDERCLCNEINQQGRKVVLVNLDDHCFIQRIEREGIFVQTGDIVTVWGSALSGSGQFWAEPNNTCLDTDILYRLDAYEIIDYIDPTVSEFTFTFEAIRSGRTKVKVWLYWMNELIRTVEFDVYVNQHPCLCAVCPRDCIDDCYDDEDYDFCHY